MTDRELLELAAKAAGVKIIRVTDTGMPLIIGEDESGKHWDSWNPLTDDGDALRLAVKLHIDIIYHNYPDATLANPLKANGRKQAHLDDPYAATRRAIVRAAAEIGKGMK